MFCEKDKRVMYHLCCSQVIGIVCINRQDNFIFSPIDGDAPDSRGSILC